MNHAQRCHYFENMDPQIRFEVVEAVSQIFNKELAFDLKVRIKENPSRWIDGRTYDVVCQWCNGKGTIRELKYEVKQKFQEERQRALDVSVDDVDKYIKLFNNPENLGDQYTCPRCNGKKYGPEMSMRYSIGQLVTTFIGAKFPELDAEKLFIPIIEAALLGEDYVLNFVR